MTDRHPVTARAIIIGLIGAAVACFVVCWGELVVQSIQIAICQFAPAAIGLLLVVVILNGVLRRFLKRFSLGAHEVITIYMMILVAALTTSRGLLERWIGALVAVNYYATPANHWEQNFFGNIPQWAVPWDVKGGAEAPIVKTFYEGLKPGAPIPFQPWLGPLGAWLIVVVCMTLSYAFIASIMRRQWVDNEKLSFPLINLPVEMARGESEGKGFFSNPLMWAGFALPTFVFMFNGLHGLYPSIPLIPVQYNLNLWFGPMGRPWRDLGYTVAYCSMAAVGFSYFLPAEILVSLWSFYVLLRAENIMFSAFGAAPEAMPLYPTTLWSGYHVAGAYIVVAFGFVRSALPHLRHVWAVTIGTEREAPGTPREFIPYRWAVLGLAITSVISAYWFTQLGMSAWMAVVEVVVFLFVVVVVMARSVSEAGMLMTETSFRPVDIVKLFTKASALGPKTLTALSLADAVFTRDLRGNLTSTFLDGLKMTDLVKLDRRHLFWAICGALVVALVVGGTLHLVIPYRMGAVSLYGYVYRSNPILGFQHFQPAMEAPDRWDPRLPAFFGGGVLVAAFLSAMRARYAWWPFAPLGFALSGSWSMIVFWFPILIAWIIKTNLIRYGGMKVYMRLKPLFLGLILGEFSQAVLWAAIAGIWRVPAPFFPWP
jgi:hypothetical protein